MKFNYGLIKSYTNGDYYINLSNQVAIYISVTIWTVNTLSSENAKDRELLLV